MQCDTTTTVTAINSGFSKDRFTEKCLRELHMNIALNNCEIRSVYLEGVKNDISNALSRWWENDKFKVKFTNLVKGIKLKKWEVFCDIFNFALN